MSRRQWRGWLSSARLSALVVAAIAGSLTVGVGVAPAHSVRYGWPGAHRGIRASSLRALRERAAHRSGHGRRSSRAHVSIAGGTQIGIGQAPWQVEVFAELPGGGGIACGGAVLDSTHVLTAAHCAFNPESKTRLAASAL